MKEGNTFLPRHYPTGTLLLCLIGLSVLLLFVLQLTQTSIMLVLYIPNKLESSLSNDFMLRRDVGRWRDSVYFFFFKNTGCLDDNMIATLMY